MGLNARKVSRGRSFSQEPYSTIVKKGEAGSGNGKGEDKGVCDAANQHGNASRG